MEITLLGPPAITANGQAHPLGRNAKGLALLAYLIVNSEPQPRESLADLLWDSASTAASLRNLRVLINRIRPDLPGLLVTREALGYAPAPGDQVDYLALARGLAAGEADLRLYTGDLLDGFYVADAPRFQEWLALERERLRRAVLGAARSRCQALAAAQQWAEGAEAAAHWLRVDPLDEEAARWRMQFLAAGGQAPQALVEYEQFRARLQQALGFDPEPETLALVDKLQSAYRDALAGLFSGGDYAVRLAWPDRGELAPPGPLPPQARLPFRRNPDFVGRRDALLALAQSLVPWPDAPAPAVPPCVVVTGLGGLGKTQLANEFAYRYGRFFAGGVYWLNFEAPQDVPEEAAATGGRRGLHVFDDNPALPFEQRLERVRHAWQAPVPRLLIFDNCEDEDLLRAWLPVTGGCRVLVTSRRGAWARDLGAQTLALDVLAEAESVALLRGLAPRLSEAEAHALAGEVGHLPLALHLAGGFLRRYAQMSVDDFLAQLRHAPLLAHPALQGRGSEPSPTGHELNVARTFALSLDRLDVTDRAGALARRLLLHAACLAPAAPIARDFLLSTAGLAPSAQTASHDLEARLLATEALQQLDTLGLLRMKSSEHVVIHPLIAAFCQQAAMPGEWAEALSAVEAAVVAAVTTVVRLRRSFESQPPGMGHLRHVTDNALAAGTAQAAALAVLLGRCLTTISLYTEAEAYQRRALAAAEQQGDVRNQAQALIHLASALERLGRQAQSLEAADRAVALLAAADPPEPDSLGEAYMAKSMAHFRLNQPHAALAAAEAGYAATWQAGNMLQAMRCRMQMGVVNYYSLNAFEQAEAYLQEARDYYTRMDLSASLGAVLNNQGECARLQGDYERAAEHYREAAVMFRGLGYTYQELIALSNLGGALAALGHFDEAAETLRDVLARTPARAQGLSETYRFMAEALLGQGQLGPALEAGQQALAEADPAFPYEAGHAWRVLGRVAAALGRPVAAAPGRHEKVSAEACFQTSLDLFTTAGSRRGEARTLLDWARHDQRRGATASAQTRQEAAKAIYEALGLKKLSERVEAFSTD